MAIDPFAAKPIGHPKVRTKPMETGAAVVAGEAPPDRSPDQVSFDLNGYGPDAF